ncbi:Protein rolling stone [Lamellibrachia satsuma]|nr:Protein rolling stone [Lamellibrachia satsuma]
MATPAPTVSAKLFIEPQAGGLSLAYVAYRVGVAIYFMSVIVWGMLLYGFDRMLLLYLTNWTFFLQTLHIIIQAAFVLRHYVIKLMHRDTIDLDNRPLPLLLRLDWVLYNITMSMSLIVSIVYWTILYDGWHLDPIEVATHGANSACVLIDLTITSIPVELTHMYQPIAYGLIYVFATFLYWLGGGVGPQGFPYIYPILNYSDNPIGSLLVVVLTTVATGLVHCAMCWLRRVMYLLCKPQQPGDRKTEGGVQDLPLRSPDDGIKLLEVAKLPQYVASQASDNASRVASSSDVLVATKPDGVNPSLDAVIAPPFVSPRSNMFASSTDRRTSLEIATLSPHLLVAPQDVFVASLPDIGRMFLDVSTVSDNVKTVSANVGAALSEVASLPGIVRAVSEYTVALSNESDMTGIG